MFGIGKKKDDPERGGGGGSSSSLSSAMSPANPPQGGGGSSLTGFDPEGLERAAKAARELDASRNAPAAIELIKSQEATKQVSFIIICMASDLGGGGSSLSPARKLRTTTTHPSL